MRADVLHIMSLFLPLNHAHKTTMRIESIPNDVNFTCKEKLEFLIYLKGIPAESIGAVGLKTIREPSLFDFCKVVHVIKEHMFYLRQKFKKNELTLDGCSIDVYGLFINAG